MTDQTVPEPTEIPVAELTRGTWIQAIDEDGCDHGEAEVLHVEAFQGSAVILYRPRGFSGPRTSYFDNAANTVPVLSAEQLAEAKAAAERAERIADIRAFADFLEQHPQLPVTNIRMQASINLNGDVWNGGAEGVAEVRRLAGFFDCKVAQDDEHITATREVGATEYVIVAWHKGGRPAEPEAAKPLVSDETLAELDAMAARDLAAGGKPWEVPSHPENSQPGGWHHGQLDPQGFGYSRVDEDPQVIRPHSPRLPLHTGGVVDGGQLVDETPAETRFPLVHLARTGQPSRCGMPAEEIAATVHGDSTTVSPLDVTCQDCREAANLAPVEEIRKALDEVPASGLTVAADLSRGPLAGTTPVVAYFSFGYGQTDPDTGKKLIDHYVTVVAPTYDACREAMFASRFGRAWSFDYLAGRAKTTEAVSQWTEHEVIVAPGTNEDLAKAALKAAGDLLYGAPGSEAR